MLSLPRWLRPTSRRPLLWPARPARSPQLPLTLEQLEDRCLLSVDPILEWNAIALEANRIDHSNPDPARIEQLGPTRTSRALAITHAAMFDAFNSIDPQFTPYLVTAPGIIAEGASIDAAVAQAAHDVLVVLYPSQQAFFDARLDQTLRRVPDGVAEDRGVAVGQFVASAIWAAREGDGGDQPDGDPTQILAPGFFRTFPEELPALTPDWGSVTPFVIPDRTEFIPADTARFGTTVEERLEFLGTFEYARDYFEVLALGGDGVTTPTLRTPEQEIIALYWGYDAAPGIGTPNRLYNQIVREVAIQESNTVAENARLFALVNLAMADAAIVAWGSKYDLDFWRPIRGIRQLDPEGILLDDENPFTLQDPNWTPLFLAAASNPFPGPSPFVVVSPPFPAPPSGHATFGAAMAEVMRQFYGTDEITFTFISDEFNGVTRDARGFVRPIIPRTFTSFTQVAQENADSRIYLGVHWRFDATLGLQEGTAVGNFVFSSALLPLGGGSDGGGTSPQAGLTAVADSLSEVAEALPAPVPRGARQAVRQAARQLEQLANGNLIEALSSTGGSRVLSEARRDALVQRVTTVVTRVADRLENIADRVGRRADSAEGATQEALEGVEARLRDLVFQSRDFVERLGELV